MRMTGSYAYPWETLTEQQQTARLDEILDNAGDFYYIAERDSYGRMGSMWESADYAPAADVERRRKYRDAHR